MKKAFLLLGVVVIIAAGVYFFVARKSIAPTAPEGKMIIQSESGTITVNDVLTAPQEVLKDENGKKEVLVEQTPRYAIYYFAAADGQSFLIGINDPDVKTVRLQAEQEFLAHLGITQEQACKLPVSVSVPISYNEDLAGRNLGLSFCSGSEQL